MLVIVVESTQQFPTFPNGVTTIFVGAETKPWSTTMEFPDVRIVAVPVFSVVYPSLSRIFRVDATTSSVILFVHSLNLFSVIVY